MIQKKEKQKRTKLGGRDFRGEGCRQDWRIESDGKERTEKSPTLREREGTFEAANGICLKVKKGRQSRCLNTI